MCVTCPQHPAAPLSGPLPPQHNTGEKAKRGEQFQQWWGKQQCQQGRESSTRGGATATGKKGRNQCAGITKWTCAGGINANTRTSVHGTKGPIQGTNAPTNISFPVHPNHNGGQNDNAPIPGNEPDFAPQIPPLKNDFVPPTTYEQIPTAPQAKVRAGHAPPHHVESPARASSSARTPHTSRPGSAPVALSSPHALLHNASFPPGNNS